MNDTPAYHWSEIKRIAGELETLCEDLQEKCAEMDNGFNFLPPK